MQLSRIKSVIIGPLLVLLALALGGCNALRLTFANGPQLAWWWIDSYLDFDREQTPRVKQALERWFEWQRSSQLPDYAALLASARQQVLEPTTAEAACRWQDRVRQAAEPGLLRAIAEFTDILPGLGEAQFKHLEQRYAKIQDELRGDFMQSDLAERARESAKRVVERAERVYGRLGEAQLAVVAAGVAASPFDPELWLAERQRNQRDAVQTLRRLVAERADREQRQTALRALVQRAENSRQAQYRVYQARLTEYNCAFAARIHNATTPEQRRQARERLQGWEEDLKALAAAPGS